VTRLADRVAIVTGGGAGIGRASAIALAREGAAVVVADIRAEAADSVAAELRASGGRATATRTDVSDEASVCEMVSTAVKTYGGLDILHNNASDLGLLRGDGEVTEMDLALWERTLAISLTGPMLGCKHAVPYLIERGGGSIVNTSSINGLRGDITRTAYGAAKGGLNTLTKYVAATYGSKGVRCNAICPGMTRTQPGMRADDPGLAPMLRSTPVGRMAEPEEVAELVVFLASPASAFLTGQVIEIDGGMLTQMPYLAEYAALGRRPGERTKG
jgi:NAD(P)-dependent dehydrogenase (short-subunit alcohol dehydrogenase family)